MRKIINKKLCNTETATNLGSKHVGEFGQPDGYEEQLFVTKTNQYFLYVNGGPESKYTKENIFLISDKEADEWKKENIQE